jgi:hypothetical protein
MSPSQWGPPTWLFMHTLVEKVKEESYPIIGGQIITNIIQICANLPCPDCADHSKIFWSKVKICNIKTKQDLINLIFVFHNTVNKRKQLAPFKYDDLQYYKSKNIINTFNTFSANFNTKGNMKLLTESFHRGRLVVFLRNWLIGNIVHFDQ